MGRTRLGLPLAVGSVLVTDMHQDDPLRNPAEARGRDASVQLEVEGDVGSEAMLREAMDPANRSSACFREDNSDKSRLSKASKVGT